MNRDDLRASIHTCESEFVQLILKRLGIVVRNQNTDLTNSIIHACQKFDCTPLEYLNKLVTCADNSPLLEHLITDITVGETYFFRDKQQMATLQNKVLPRIIKAKREKNHRSLRIWSAACSSGEEIYTIAILLNEILHDINYWSIHLLGTDIDTEALKKAKKGVYSKWSMRSIPDYYKVRYFSEKDNKFYLSPNIINKVDFQYLNLNDNTYPSLVNGTNAQDLIICRNALIYFSKECTQRLMKKIHASLIDDGVLLLGASDPVAIEGTEFVFHHEEGMVFSRQGRQKEANSPPLSYSQKTLPKIPSITVKKPTTLGEITLLMERRCWQEVLNLINRSNTTKIAPYLLYSTKAKALANLGQLEEAVQCCQESLLLDSTRKDTYFTYALILIELERLNEAEAMLRKSLFLDRHFVEAHVQLGLLLVKNKKSAAGLKSLNNALVIAQSKGSLERVDGLEELNYGRFAEILKSEIELVTGTVNDNQKK